MEAAIFIILISMCAVALSFDLRRIEREKEEAESKLFDNELERILGS